MFVFPTNWTWVHSWIIGYLFPHMTTTITPERRYKIRSLPFQCICYFLYSIETQRGKTLIRHNIIGDIISMHNWLTCIPLICQLIDTYICNIHQPRGYLDNDVPIHAVINNVSTYNRPKWKCTPYKNLSNVAFSSTLVVYFSVTNLYLW